MVRLAAPGHGMNSAAPVRQFRSANGRLDRDQSGAFVTAQSRFSNSISPAAVFEIGM
jgi:hypothetical protein